MDFFEKFGKGIAKKQIKKPGFFLLALVVVLALVLPGIPLLLNNVEPSLEKILPQEVQEVKTMNDMRSQFGADMMYLVFEVEGPVQDMRHPDVIKYLDDIEKKIRTNDHIKEVMGLPDLVKQVNDNIIPDSKNDIEQLVKMVPESRMFLNRDNSIAMIQIRADTGPVTEIISRVISDLEDAIHTFEPDNPGLSYSITGFNAIDKATFEVIIKDFAVITGFSFSFILIFLFIYYSGDWRKVISSISVILFAVLITLGITGYIGITVTVVTMVAAAMIMALGISYGINVTYEYYLLREKKDKKSSLMALNSSIVRALTGSSLTTSAGFLALLFGIIPAMKNLGIVLAIGISITLAISVMVLPVIIYKLDNKPRTVTA